MVKKKSELNGILGRTKAYLFVLPSMTLQYTCACEYPPLKLRALEAHQVVHGRVFYLRAVDNGILPFDVYISGNLLFAMC